MLQMPLAAVIVVVFFKNVFSNVFHLNMLACFMRVVCLVLALIFGNLKAYSQDFRLNYLSFDPTGSNTKGDAITFDYDGDGDLDILGGYESSSELLLYKNNGVGFETIVLADSFQGYNNFLVADFNNDGLPDYVVVYKIKGAWHTGLYVNDGNYQYNYQLIETGGADNADKLEAKDMDNDGDIDLVLDSEERIEVFYYIKNLGNLKFAYEKIEFDGWPAHLLAIDDINNDGYMDVFCAMYLSSIRAYQLVVAEQDLSAKDHWVIHNIAVRDDVNMNCLATDFTGDGNSDFLLAPSNPSNTTAVLMEFNSDFSIRKTSNFTVPSNSGFSLGQDFDKSGSIDFMLNGGGGNSIYLNNGKGIFTKSQTSIESSRTAKIWGDFNQDGFNDLFFVGYSNFEVDYNGDDKYKAFWKNNSEGAENVVLTDLDANGKLDVLSTRFGTWNLIRNNVKDQLLPTESIDMAGRISEFGFFSEPIGYDYDKDGDMDFLSSQDQFPIWIENDNGSLKAIEAEIPSEKVFHTFKIGDFDKDGNPDFVNLRFDIMIFEWENGKFHETNVPAGSRQYDVMDVDNDGDDDIVYVRWNSSTANGVLAYVENDNGSFKSIDIVSLESFTTKAVTDNESSLDVFDINSDGYKDIVILSYDDKKAVQFINNGNASFTGSVIAENISEPTDVQVADLDMDGFNDVLVLSRNYGRVYAYMNDSNKTYSSRIITSKAGIGLQLKTGDLDDDGDIDVFTCSQYDHKILWLENELIDCKRQYTETFDSICFYDSLLVNGVYYKDSRLLSDTLNGSKCDSILFRYLFQKPEIVYELKVSGARVFLENASGPVSWFKNGVLLNLEEDTLLDMSKYGIGTYSAEFETGGCLSRSDTYEYQITSIKDITNELKVYPNPSSGKLIIENGESTLMKQWRINLITSTGQSVFSGMINQKAFEIDLGSLGGKGLYFIQLYNTENELVEVRKVLLE